MSKTVFITGASGWIGRHVVTELLEHGWKIIANARSDESAQALQSRGINVVRAGLEDVDALAAAAKEADAVIHLARIHDYSPEGQKRAHAADVASIKAFGAALEGTNKALVGTSGIFAAGSGELTEHSRDDKISRAEVETLTLDFASKGVRSIVIRPGVSNHGDGDNGFVPTIIAMARKNGVAAYIGDGANRWPAVHVKDTAVLYRLAIEKDVPGGTMLHSIAESGVKFKSIAEAVGKGLGVEVKSVTPDEAPQYFGGLAMFVGADANASSEITRKLTGWVPKEKGLLDDLAEGTYFA